VFAAHVGAQNAGNLAVSSSVVARQDLGLRLPNGKGARCELMMVML
jgi:hypothetical protein